jgi:hypothetical protein
MTDTEKQMMLLVIGKLDLVKIVDIIETDLYKVILNVPGMDNNPSRPVPLEELEKELEPIECSK